MQMDEREESFVSFVKQNDHKEHWVKVTKVQDGWRDCKIAPNFFKLSSSFLDRKNYLLERIANEFLEPSFTITEKYWAVEDMLDD